MSAVSDLDVMARTIWGESRGEPFEGQVAVGHVIANRARRGGWWGKDIESVCKAPSQFSCWLPGDPNLPKLQWINLNDPGFLRAHGIAALVMTGDLPDFSQDATSYYATSIAPPAWVASMRETVTIGHHRFFAEGA